MSTRICDVKEKMSHKEMIMIFKISNVLVVEER
jgi:hypothetical protein